MWDQHLTGELAVRARGEIPKTRHVALGNSDAHWDSRTDHETNYPGKDLTWVHSPNGVAQPDILAAMRGGRCVASQSIENGDCHWVAIGPLVAGRLVRGGKSSGIGDTITVPRNTDVDLEIEWASHTDLNEILVVGANGKRLLSISAPPAAMIKDGYDYLRAEWKPIVDRLAAKGLSRISAHTQTRKLRFNEPGYVRLVATTQGEQPKRAFTNPIWVMVR